MKPYSAIRLKGKYNKHLIVPEELIAEDQTFHQKILAGKTIQKETFRKTQKGALIPVSFLGYPAMVKNKIERAFKILCQLNQS
ncbi:MAG: hypothetical protein HUK40_07530 [Desulfobacter sp.]|nr:hypothetical protein [Desulfobacter sp.]